MLTHGMPFCHLTLPPSSLPHLECYNGGVINITTLVPPLPLLPDMTLDDVREYERQMHEKTNIKVCHEQQEHSTTNPSSLDIEIHDKASVCVFSLFLTPLPLLSPIWTIKWLTLEADHSCSFNSPHIHSPCPVQSETMYMKDLLLKSYSTMKNILPQKVQTAVFYVKIAVYLKSWWYKMYLEITKEDYLHIVKS